MKACADKDLRVVTEGQKKPAMAKFQHLQHVSRPQRLQLQAAAPRRAGRRAHEFAFGYSIDAQHMCVCLDLQVNELLRQKSHHEAFIQQDGLSAIARCGV
jgi:hypothetical protein